MNTTYPNQDLAHNQSHETALTDFFHSVRLAIAESGAAVAAAKSALGRITKAIARRDNSQALRVRSLLISLYAGGDALADVSDLMGLDWTMRKDVCAVLLAFGHGGFDHEYIKTAFEQAGDIDAEWFHAAAPQPRNRLHEALDFARAGHSRESHTSGAAMGRLLVSIFAGMPVDLHETLKTFDAERSKLVLDIISGYLSGYFDFADADEVRTCLAPAA